MSNFRDWFHSTTDYIPHQWQVDLASDSKCKSRLIRIPTGLGKTMGVLATWIYHRIINNDDTWPRRLVWCLPMRVLVEQTEAVARNLLLACDRLWDDKLENRDGKVGVHLLMGGEDTGDWHLYPEHPAILIGTQDMLLSRALNRGYASSRARWPMDYAWLNNDCLWVADEVQLMDVGLATSVQLQAFRHAQARVDFPRVHTWWMSATLQPDWLETTDAMPVIHPLRERMVHVQEPDKTGPLWSITKPLEIHTIADKDDKQLTKMAGLAANAHAQSEAGAYGRVTLVVMNTVERASDFCSALKRALGKKAPVDVRLVHSRYRGMERREWSREFLAREHCNPTTDRIIVATQVVEAGVDISATTLVTELAPWSCLVQRFGRAARYGGSAQVHVVDRRLEGKGALPYDDGELSGALAALQTLDDASVSELEALEQRLAMDDPRFLTALYPYDPLHILTQQEAEELFDTGPDLTGSDLDISRFIRSGEDRDIQVFWVPVSDDGPTADIKPTRDGLCRVSLMRVISWLFDNKSLKKGCRAWVFDYLTSEWRRLRKDDVYPGQVFLVDAAWGGYQPTVGFTGKKPGAKDAPLVVEGGYTTQDMRTDADRAQSRDDQSMYPWKRILTHNSEVAREVVAVAQALALPVDLADALQWAARLHDWGKSHPAFASSIATGELAHLHDLAKAPRTAWVALHQMYKQDESSGSRSGFRHELASAIAVLEVLRLDDPYHPALLGPYRELVTHGVLDAPDDTRTATALGAQLVTLDAPAINLLVYLICAHHGKVRASWQSTPQDQEFKGKDCIGQGQPLRGIRDGDVLPEVELPLPQGESTVAPAITLHLDASSLGLSSRYGASWVERVSGLLHKHGNYGLAWLEALMRVADVRASRLDTPDATLSYGDQR